MKLMTQLEFDIFDSHNWAMKKIHNNVRGEPVYVTMCTRCNRLVSEVQRSWMACPFKETDDQRTTGSVS